MENTQQRETFGTMLSPIRAGRRTLRNRVIMGSMHTRLETEPDSIAKQIAFYAERARGEAAILVTGGFSPNAEGIFDPKGPRIDDPDQARHLRPICEAVQAEGSLICAQLLHAGRYAKIEGCVAPSPIRSPINRFVPREMTDADIRRTIADFASAAANAQAAGFDGVEIMGSEGYLINEFTVTHTNKREDGWGGNAENRHRFPVEIVRAVRERCGPGFLIIYRISAADLVEGGAHSDEIAALARKIEAAGADILNTGIGWHESRVPTIAYPVPRGAWRKAAANVKAAVSIPVVASNRINTPELAEDILTSGDADMISMARPFLADPYFVKKNARGPRKRDQHLHRLQPGLSGFHLFQPTCELSSQSTGGSRNRISGHADRITKQVGRCRRRCRRYGHGRRGGTAGPRRYAVRSAGQAGRTTEPGARGTGQGRVRRNLALLYRSDK